MLVLPILAGVFAGVAIGATLASRQGRRQRFNAVVRSAEHEGEVLYHGVIYAVPDDNAPLPGDEHDQLGP